MGQQSTPGCVAAALSGPHAEAASAIVWCMLPCQVCILDGFGYNTEDKWNGIHMAETPVYDSLRKNKERFR